MSWSSESSRRNSDLGLEPVGCLCLAVSAKQTVFLFPFHIFLPLYISLENSTKLINTFSLAVFPGHQGSHMFCLMVRFSSSSDIWQGCESLRWCSCLFKGRFFRKGKMMFRLTAAHTKCLVFSAGSLAVNTTFMSAVWRKELWVSLSYHFFSTQSRLPCLTNLDHAYAPVRSRDMNVSLKWISSAISLLR